ncbi:NmrA family NAD(P)-binding protein [Reichenbachiella agariperforans]|uniref:NmrA family NAD(P)-binding protein n=1 Tax=Reichenbachiella agariperforans TaxID=156994 RepID=UPI001C096F8B|nr:NAD(P)H-binding protein [Reichenbachiella agariperforans]MBU2913716.1 NAD(P)H-binding protein [Reichenbachiella agariperforans]
MKIVLTGSLGRIGKPLTKSLVKIGHSVTVISSKTDRQKEIETLGAKAAIGSMQDVDFLSTTFKDADVVYLMIAWDAIGNIFDKNIDFPTEFSKIASKYKQAVKQAGVKKVVHLSSVGAHTNQGIGSLSVYNGVEDIMNQLPTDVSIKFMRPVAFYPNLFRFMESIKTDGAIMQSYGGDKKEPWVSPLDIADAIVEEMEKPFDGRNFRYIASDEVSPNEVATILGEAIGNPDLKWQAVPAEELLRGVLASGMNEWVAKGFIEMQAAQGSGILYEDFYKNKPDLGKVKMADFVKEFAAVYKQ